MRDRSTLIDLGLVFAATFVITLAMWPQATPRQVVRCNTPELGWKTYSIAINDPSLDALKKKVHRWKTPEFHPQYVTAKWQKETAEFYEKSIPCAGAEEGECSEPTRDDQAPTTATLSDTVATASYEMPLQPEPQAVQSAGYIEATVDDEAASPSDANYWSNVKASAEASMEVVEARTANVPVVFEGVARSGWPQLAFHFAFLFGIAAACGYMHWQKLAPTRRETTFHDQPVAVLARIGTFAGSIVLAMVSCIAVWI